MPPSPCFFTDNYIAPYYIAFFQLSYVMMLCPASPHFSQRSTPPLPPSSPDPSLSSLLQLFLSELEWPPWMSACLSGAMCAGPGKAEGLAGISTLIPAIMHPEGVIIVRPIRCRSQAYECRRSSGSGQLP